MNERLTWSLLSLRLTVFLVMFMWTLDKLINVGHAKKIYEHFYFLSGLGDFIMYGIAIIELVIILAFLIGFKKRISYGLILIFHFISTISSYQQYLNPFENLLFFAAWPMLGACISLYLLRDYDTKWTVD